MGHADDGADVRGRALEVRRQVVEDDAERPDGAGLEERHEEDARQDEPALDAAGQAMSMDLHDHAKKNNDNTRNQNICIQYSVKCLGGELMPIDW